MKNLLRTGILAIMLSITFTDSGAANRIAKPLPNAKIYKVAVETIYFWGFIPGSPCLHLFALQDRGGIDYNGVYVSDYFLVEMNMYNYIRTSSICPQNPNEWYV